LRRLAAILAACTALGACVEHLAPQGPYQCTSGADCIDGWSCRETDTASLSICVEGIVRDASDGDGAELPEASGGDGQGPDSADG